MQFAYQAYPTRVVFGEGAFADLPREVDAIGARRLLLLSTPERTSLAQRAAAMLGDRVAGVYAQAMMHVPVETARAASSEARRLGADAVVAAGGGSTIGLAKAIALDTGLPIVAVPTTYAGSEMTPIYGLTEGAIKRTGRDVRVLPKTVVYDPKLTATLPLRVTVTSALNAIAHAAEGLYAPDGNPIAALMAEESIRALAAALPRLQADLQDTAARAGALYGAWLAGSVLGMVTIGLHHKLCHTLGGSFNLPHADVHAVILPHALAYNATHAEGAMRRIAHAIGAADAARGMHDLARRLGAPISLREIGMPAVGIDRAVDLAVSTPYPNPRPLERVPLRTLLQRAYDGEAPQEC